MKINFRELKYLLELRGTEKNHPQFRELILEIKSYFEKEFPEIFAPESLNRPI